MADEERARTTIHICMTNNPTIVIADADALIALANPDDVHHTNVRAISEFLDTNEIAILFPGKDLY